MNELSDLPKNAPKRRAISSATQRDANDDQRQTTIIKNKRPHHDQYRQRHHDHRPQTHHFPRDHERSPKPIHTTHSVDPQRKKRGRPFAPKVDNTPTDHNLPPSGCTLHWPLGQDSSLIPAQVETNILPVLVRWGCTERGMLLSQPPFRLPLIRKACRTNHIQLIQALSLRRTYIKYLNPHMSMEALGLGEDSHIRQSASLFEQAVANFLKDQGVEFMTEEDQRRNQQEILNNQMENVDGEPCSTFCTPDFLFNQPVSLCTKGRDHDTNRAHQSHHTIHWIEAKMFYGASVIPQGTNNAVGTVLERAKKYVHVLGPGAMVFAFGCGSDLARQLENIGVQVIDSYPLNLTALREYQRSWCCNEQGEVLF